MTWRISTGEPFIAALARSMTGVQYTSGAGRQTLDRR
jgi:hypothetical protein